MEWKVNIWYCNSDYLCRLHHEGRKSRFYYVDDFPDFLKDIYFISYPTTLNIEDLECMVYYFNNTQEDYEKFKKKLNAMSELSK